MPEQRNPYRGGRAWLRLGFQDGSGTVRHLDLLADTGCPAGVMIRADLFDALVRRPTGERRTNYGPAPGGWLRLYNPELDLVELIEGCGSDEAARMAGRSSLNFVGVVGLPILRLGEYGGNSDSFWFRSPPTTPADPL